MHNHPAYREGETIAAVATPPGSGGIAVIRLSGPDALPIGQRLFSKNLHIVKGHTAHFGIWKDAAGSLLDEVLVTVFKNPRSYTGEDTLEISCHGGVFVTRSILSSLFAVGAKPAQAGEFTMRAFLNGKLDLAQAEAVQELISAKSECAAEASQQQLMGALSKRVKQFQLRLTDIMAILEAWVDFPEEGVEFGTLEDLSRDLEEVNKNLHKWISTYHDGRVLHEGLTLCLLGRPNVGKSSLLNALVEKERAIVTDIPGTTRDMIEEHLSLSGLSIKLVDTAGIREANECVEKEGIKRSLRVSEEADLILLLLDASQGMTKEDQELLKQLPTEKTLLIWNKVDITKNEPPEGAVAISALKEEGISNLKDKIHALIWKHGPPDKGEVLISNLRHKEALETAYKSFDRVITGFKDNISPEFLAFDMRDGLNALGTIIGMDVTEEVLSSIFSRFCIGK